MTTWLFFARAVEVEKRESSEVERQKVRKLTGEKADAEENEHVTRLRRKNSQRSNVGRGEG